MNIVLRTLTGMLAAVFGAGLFLVATTTVSASAADQNFAAKRPDGLSEVVTVDDDARDDDDTTTTRGGGGGTNSGTGNSNDGTNSRHTAVSRDKDRSRGDLTKDWTRDGGDRTRDHSKNFTNDRSRNDTR